MGPLLKKQSFEGTALSLLKQVIYSQEENIKTTPILFSGGKCYFYVFYLEKQSAKITLIFLLFLKTIEVKILKHTLREKNKDTVKLWCAVKELPKGKIGAHTETCCTN